ncbi:MAG TPA: hypothetical protein VI565_06380, partial [Burkholderiales bacterium]|nr:hypothetical protein [Burkholderiales bacterium]
MPRYGAVRGVMQRNLCAATSNRMFEKVLPRTFSTRASRRMSAPRSIFQALLCLKYGGRSIDRTAG